MNEVWIDGELVAERDAMVPALTPGVQVGYGVFESLAVIGGTAFALTRHLGRLAASATILDLDVGVGDDELRAAVAAVLAGSPDATRVRITVSAGPGPRGAPTTVVVNALAQAPWPPFTRVVVSPWVRNERAPTTGAKATSYVDNRLALADAHRRGADEALLFDTRGHLSEGSASNVFVGIDGVLCTPAASNGCLGGMTRELLLELVDVAVRDDLTLDDLRSADELFVTSSTRGVHPVATLDGVAPRQVPGPLTRAAGQAYADLVARDLDP